MSQKAVNRKNPFWIFGAIGAFLYSQLKWLLPLLKLGKVGGAIVSMFVSIGAYALLTPLPFAIGLVLMLFIHEMGHVLAAKRKHLPVSAPVFIPFLGALITMKKHPTDAVTEAYLAFGGPLLGSVGAACALGLGYLYDSQLLLSIAYLGFYLNLINLLPIHPLDGGRISVAVTRWLWLVGLVGGAYVILRYDLLIFLFFWVPFAMDLYKKYIKNRDHNVIFTAQADFEHPIQHVLEQGAFHQGSEHVRQLPFTTFSSIEENTTGAQTVEMYWDGIDFVGRMQLGRQGIVKRVYVDRAFLMNHYDGPSLHMHCVVEFTAYENDSYFDVPTATRWQFGLAYTGLALALIYCIHLVHVLENL